MQLATIALSHIDYLWQDLDAVDPWIKRRIYPASIHLGQDQKEKERKN